MGLDWKLSSFSSVIPGESGDLLFHNSFMGAVARVPAAIAARICKLTNGTFDGSALQDPAVKELCDQGFFVRADGDERKTVSSILDNERSDQLGLMILPHENCNFRCVYCYETFARGRMTADVIAGLRAFVDRNVGNHGGLGVAWFGGEPLLAFDVIRDLSEYFLESCHRHGVGYRSGMSTNGYLLTPTTVSALLEHRVTSFQVCIDGPEAVHNRKRRLAGGQGTYRTILENLTYMRERDEDFFVSIRTNFDKESAPHLEAWLIDELAPLFARDPRFGLHFEPVTRRGGVNDAALCVYDPQASFALRSSLHERALDLGFSDLNAKTFLVPHGMVCYAAREWAFVVGTDGRVYKCSLAFTDPRNVVGRVTTDGHLLLDGTKASQWTSLEGRDARDCDDCPLYGCCQGRKCPLVTIKQNKPTCPITREMHATLVKAIAYGRGVSVHRD